jgi:hypothetical protein
MATKSTAAAETAAETAASESMSLAEFSAQLKKLEADMKALKEENESLKSDRAAAEKAAAPAPSLDEQPKVKVKLFKDGRDYKDDVFIQINGRSYLIQRGVEVEVPEAVAEVLKRVEAYRAEADKFIYEQTEQYAEMAANL